MTPESKQTESAPAPTEPTATAEPKPETKEPARAKHKTVKVSGQELEELKAKAAQADENWDKFLRAAAELDNYRKRVARDKEELARYTSERVVAALLPVLDNLDRALAAAEAHGGDNTSLLDGLKQIQSQFRRTLEQFGLQEVIASAGHPFDPNLHEAVGHTESAEHPEGHVIEQLQRGYKLADHLLRPARVVVSKGLPVGPPNGRARPPGEPQPPDNVKAES
jgi:molecular chaperone GrpE